MAKDTTPKWNAKRDLPLLKRIAEATIDPTRGFSYEKPDDCKALTYLGHAEMNTNLTDPAEPGVKYAVRATQQGVTESGVTVSDNSTNNEDDNSMSDTTLTNGVADAGTVGENTGAVVTAAEPKTRAPRKPIDVSSVQLGMGAPPAAAEVATRGRKSQYPFASLAAPQGPQQMAYFFVPSDGRKDMLKLVAGNVAAHNKKLRDNNSLDAATGALPVFKAFEQTVDGAAGVAVYRIA